MSNSKNQKGDGKTGLRAGIHERPADKSDRKPEVRDDGSRVWKADTKASLEDGQPTLQELLTEQRRIEADLRGEELPGAGGGEEE